MRFEAERSQFFKPLTSKYRAVVVECLRVLYQRQFSANADYGESLRRDQVLDIFEEALARAPVLEGGDDERETRFKGPREQAGWILGVLIEHGWLQKQVDQATLQSTFPFTRVGRLFTQALVEVSATTVRTRHRNTRNTLNALEAFLARGDVHDLLDAYEYSQRIISDFSDIIAELEERKRELVRQVESQLLVEQATEQFFDFMEKRFQPDVAVRLSADSVEKHRDAIQDAIGKIRRKRKEFKRDAEVRLRELVPELIDGRHSVLYALLDTIELRMRNAADLMLPALRRALQGFTKRADIIIRQLTYLHSQRSNDVLTLCRKLSELTPADQAQCLEQASTLLAGLRVQFTDPEAVRLQQRRSASELETRVDEQPEVDPDARRSVLVQHLLDQAFVMPNDGLRDYLLAALDEQGQIRSDELPVGTARELLAMAHAIEIAAQTRAGSDLAFSVSPTGETGSNAYFSRFDVFRLALAGASQRAEPADDDPEHSRNNTP